MILTRCPTCATTFRVRPEQLRVRQGRVRCGTCSRPFNALESLIEDDFDSRDAVQVPAAAPEAPEIAAPPPLAPDFILDIESQSGTLEANLAASANAVEEAPAIDQDAGPGRVESEKSAGGSLFVLEDSQDERQVQLDIPELDEGVPELYVEGLSRDPASSRAPDWSMPEWEEQTTPVATRADLGETQVAPDGALDADAATDFSFAPDFDIPGDDAEPALPKPYDSLPRSGPTVESGSSITGDEVPPEPQGGASDDWGDRVDPASAGTAETRPVAGFDLGPAPRPVARAATTAPEGPDEEQHEIYPFRIAEPKPPNNALWGLGIGTLLMLLAAQSALLFRSSIVQIIPESQPAYIALCAKLGCAMDLPREAGFIAIEATALHPERNRPDTFVLRTTIQNRAAFRQEYPHLELTLTDARDTVLARRVIAPEQWRPSQASAEGFAPGSVLDISLPFEAPGLKAVGYRVYAFYP